MELRNETYLHFDVHRIFVSWLHVASEGATHHSAASGDNDAELLYPDGHLLPGRIIANVGIREGQGIGLLRSANAHPNSPNIDTNPNVGNMVHANDYTRNLHNQSALCGERKLINE